MESKLSKDKWKKKLTREQYHVLREKGTEPAFTGKYWNNHEKGIYKCAGCGAKVFSSEEKFDSGTGWPSFDKPYDESNIQEQLDASHGMRRTEVLCNNCGGHLGHVFKDGPNPNGCRYCINSISLDFQPDSKD
ncbi:MAG: peptide-methionine (R)-S-oxide reductase MsrB [Promethearchaeota archaeon]|jgi:peptide-methionine (R)-S-oxide reductase